MVYHATQLIHDYFKEVMKVSCWIEELGEFSSLTAELIVLGQKNFLIRFLSEDDDNSVSVRCHKIVSMPDDPRKKCELEELVKKLNAFTPAVKVVPTEGGVDLHYDFLMETPDEALAKMAWEAYCLFSNFLYKYYDRICVVRYKEVNHDDAEN